MTNNAAISYSSHSHHITLLNRSPPKLNRDASADCQGTRNLTLAQNTLKAPLLHFTNGS